MAVSSALSVIHSFIREPWGVGYAQLAREEIFKPKHGVPHQLR